MKFKQLFDFISEGSAVRSYSCLMLDLSFLSEQIRKVQEEICPCEVYDLEPGHGLEESPHVTCLYGIHTQQLKNIRDNIELFPIELKIGELSLFENDQYDVLKFNIISKDLHKLNKELCNRLKYTNNYKEYKPHMTVAYLKRGSGQYYLDINSELIGKTFTVNKFVFSDKLSNKVIFSI